MFFNKVQYSVHWIDTIYIKKKVLECTVLVLTISSNTVILFKITLIL